MIKLFFHRFQDSSSFWTKKQKPNLATIEESPHVINKDRGKNTPYGQQRLSKKILFQNVF